MPQGRRAPELPSNRGTARARSLHRRPRRYPTTRRSPSAPQHRPPFHQPACRTQPGPRQRRVRRRSMTHRRARIPSDPWSLRVRRRPCLPSRGHPGRGRQQRSRAVARPQQDLGPVRRRVVRRSTAWRVSRGKGPRRGLQHQDPSRTTRPRREPRRKVGVSVRPFLHRPAALLAGRPALWRSLPWTWMRYGVPARSFHSGSAAPADLAPCWSRSPRWCPCATEPRPVGRNPRLGGVEIRLGPARVRYRETATPETDPPSTFHRPVLVPGRHRARSARPRVTLRRYRPSPWCWPAATPTSPAYPAVGPLRQADPWSSAAAAVRVRPGAC
jgi:hypothetical protein